MLQAKRECVKNDVIPLFLSHTAQMIEVFLQADLPRHNAKVELLDIESHIPRDIQADMILTSPPYGDSGTTVAYEQYTSFGFE